MGVDGNQELSFFHSFQNIPEPSRIVMWSSDWTIGEKRKERETKPKSNAQFSFHHHFSPP
jgi:hypothetical protein